MATFPTTNPTWDLDPIFEGGVKSNSFASEVEALAERVELLRERVKELDVPAEGAIGEERLAQWRSFFDEYFSAGDRLGEARSFSGALASAHADKPEAVRMPARLDGIYTSLDSLSVDIQARFREVSDEAFEAFIGDERFSDMTLWLKELRRDAEMAMDPELETLAVELNQDGFHAWGRLYSEVTGRMEVTAEIDGERKTYSVGQAKNLLESPKREVRRAAHDGLTEAWQESAPICASALHSLVGTKQTLFRRRGGDCLTTALNSNRVERSTVEAMLSAAAEFRPVLVRYLKAKAKLLDLEKLEWFDRMAPVGGDSVEEISYEDAQEFIVEQVGQFSPKIADFCRHALASRWVEAEDRPGKRQGGYCTSVPVSKQVRIFMTYGGTSSGVTTLAHELGHGYHSHVMNDLPRSERHVPMGLAESASTLLEALVEQAALKKATGDKRLALLDDRLGRGVAFLMDIPARYRLELAMHEHRAKGTLHTDLLNEVTSDIYTEAYGEGMASVDELFWASKLHFYLSYMPFYNFPYTFGYLFSRAIYDRAQTQGQTFVDKLDDLLRDTGRMTSEELARKYLDGDLGDSGFWKRAAGTLAEDVDQYEEMVQSATGQ